MPQINQMAAQMGGFPYGNPLLAMSGMGLNPLMMNPGQAALAQFAQQSGISQLAAQMRLGRTPRL